MKWSALCFVWVFLVNVAAQESGKLFFKGTVIFPAVSGTELNVVSGIDRIIDAELFAARLMPFTSEKENELMNQKMLSCQNIDCILNIAQNLKITTVITSDISIVSNGYNGKLRLYDTSFKTLVSEIALSGLIKDVENNYVNGVKLLVSESRIYLMLSKFSKRESVEEFMTSKFNPIVVFKNTGTELSDQKGAQLKAFPPDKMTTFHDLNTVKNSNLVSAYEQALRADRLGESEPDKAIEAWKKVTSLADDGIIKDFSIKRSNEWFLFKKAAGDIEILKKNLEKEISYQFFPDTVLKMWKSFLITNPSSEMIPFIQKRISFYEEKSLEVKRYVEERAELTKHMKSAYSSSLKVMSLNIVGLDKKLQIILNFLEAYGSVDNDFYYLQNMIDKISNETERKTAKNSVFNKWTASFFKEKCKSKDFQACIISEQIFTKIIVFTESIVIQNNGCAEGVPELCASYANSKLENPNDIAVEEIAKKSCLMGSGKGCFVMARFDELRNFRKPLVSKDVLLRVSCDRGYVPACPVEEKPEKKNETSPIIKDNKDAGKNSVFMSKKIVQDSAKKRPESEFLRTHPYFWYGFSSITGGVVLGIVSLYYGYWADHRYETFNDLTKISKLESVREDNKENYMKQAIDIKGEGDKYKGVAIGTGVLGGALIITGSVLTFLKKPAKDNVKLSFIPSPEGFMAGATFSW